MRGNFVCDRGPAPLLRGKFNPGPLRLAQSGSGTSAGWRTPDGTVALGAAACTDPLKLGAMPAFVALLRAVNLGPHNKVAMADLKIIAASCGLTAPRTLLQSGNLLFESKTKSSAALEKLLEAALQQKLGLKTPVVVRSAAEWRRALDDNPFPKQAMSDPGHLVLMPLKAKVEPAAVAALAAAIVGREQVKLAGQHLYFVYPDGIGESKLTSALIEKKIGVSGTGRNWNTVQKIAALLEA
jgi:uncharacterized protein (DUF1697 family)